MERFADQLERLQQMSADERGETWDLSPNDRAAIAEVLKQRVVLRDIAELSNLVLAGGCCEEHHSANVRQLQELLGRFRDSSFTELKG